jgi:hypothetical protein
MIAAQAMARAKNHHDGYEAAKQDLGKFQTLLIGASHD